MAPRPIYLPQPYAPRAITQPTAPTTPRVLRGVRGNETAPTAGLATGRMEGLTPARAVTPVSIPTPESLGVGLQAAPQASPSSRPSASRESVSIPSPESLGVAVPGR
jgi:hypothetical protein